jgi:hypothetical protein
LGSELCEQRLAAKGRASPASLTSARPWLGCVLLLAKGWRGITKKPRRSGAHNQSSCAARSRLLVSFARCSW